MKIKDKEKKVALAQQQGKAYSEALDYMKGMDNHFEKEVGDYVISLAAEEAEGTYRLVDGKLKWQVPQEKYNCHLEIVVRDQNDKRFIPGLKVHGKIFNEKDELIAEKDFPLLWHPFLYHYGAMFELPEPGNYTVAVTFPAPDFHRHDEVKGKRFEKGVNVRLGPIKLETGRKPHGPE